MPRVIEFLYEYSSCVQYRKPECLLLSWWENCSRHSIMTEVQIRQPVLFWVCGECFWITAIWTPAHIMNFIFTQFEILKSLAETAIRFYCHVFLARSTCRYTNKPKALRQMCLRCAHALARLFASLWCIFRIAQQISFEFRNWGKVQDEFNLDSYRTTKLGIYTFNSDWNLIKLLRNVSSYKNWYVT
jgi:hypothetical protein